MGNILVVFASCVAVAEVIINATKETATKKISAELYTSIVLIVCGILGVAFDIYFNNPAINLVYVVEAILMVAGVWLTSQRWAMINVWSL